MEDNEKYLAHFKFEGDLVKDGYLDARKSAEALIGIDEIFRYFLYKKSPELNSLEFDLPVRTRKGSWETLIPENIGELIQLAMISGGAIYGGSALKKMAQNDIGDNGFKETKGVQFIGIYNDAGEILYVPKVYLELFTEIPETIFNRLTQLIENERKLKIGFSPNEKVDADDTKKEVSISINDKSIFYKGKEEEDVLFPELTHNQYVELEGHITRGNENSNTIGFAYNNHILTCYPISGKIVEDRTYFFGDCTIRGYINRMDKNGVYIEKRPRIAYMDILPSDKKTDEDMFSK